MDLSPLQKNWSPKILVILLLVVLCTDFNLAIEKIIHYLLKL